MKNCSRCRAELSEECSYKCCERCRESSRQRVKERDALGQCIRCGSQRDDHNKTCSACRENNNERSRERYKNPEVAAKANSRWANTKAERRSAGLCPGCGKEKLLKIQACKDCYFKDMSRAATGTAKNAQFLKQLLEAQNHRCCLTGELLVIGDNASIDHIIPRSHKDYPGDHCLDNLAWTTKDINRVKWKNTKDEFVQICRNVLQHNDKQNIGVMEDEVRSWEF